VAADVPRAAYYYTLTDALPAIDTSWLLTAAVRNHDEPRTETDLLLECQPDGGSPPSAWNCRQKASSWVA
jgi:hypothetical protein